MVKELITLLSMELEKAEEHGKKYNSPHEFYGVLLEELEEVQDEIKQIENRRIDLWNYIKMDCRGKVDETCDFMYIHIEKAITELIQCLAVITKFRVPFEYDNEKVTFKDCGANYD